jgi:Peptidase C13 family
MLKALRGMSRPNGQIFLKIILGLALLIGACAVTGSRGGTTSGGRWQAVLVAGDIAQPAFDNAIGTLSSRLTENGVPKDNIYHFSASAGARNRRSEPATLDRLLTQIARLPVQPGERCLIFVTSHGAPGRGVWLAYAHEFLRPADLARALSASCAAAPTVVIVSSCYSGTFATWPMIAPNRIILTAARSDRSSFGCGADNTYTEFDDCLLAAMPRSMTWQAVSDDIVRCVGLRERVLGQLPSLPQAYFGAAVSNLSVR